MMDDLAMADVNVSTQLEGIKERIDRQDVLLDRVVVTMEQMAVIAERTANQKDINDKTDLKIEKLDLKVSANIAQLGKIAGIGIGISISISAAFAVFTWLVPLIRSGAASALS